MSGLSDAERESLLNGVVIRGLGFIHNPRCGHVVGNKFLRKPREGDRLAGCCHQMHNVVTPDSIDDIVRAAVTAALNEAADAQGWVAMESSSHLPEKNGIGCICGFCVWSAEHVAVMSHRDGMHNWMAYRRRTPPTDPVTSSSAIALG